MTGFNARRFKKLPSSRQRGKELAERMAVILSGEDASDIAVALALLNSGIIYQYSDNIDAAKEIMAVVRQLEDRMIAKAYEQGSSQIH